MEDVRFAESTPRPPEQSKEKKKKKKKKNLQIFNLKTNVFS